MLFSGIEGKTTALGHKERRNRETLRQHMHGKAIGLSLDSREDVRFNPDVVPSRIPTTLI